MLDVVLGHVRHRADGTPRAWRNVDWADRVRDATVAVCVAFGHDADASRVSPAVHEDAGTNADASGIANQLDYVCMRP